MFKLLAGWLLPYYDPFRRRAMRRAARDLVTVSPWPGEEATSPEIAQLALLRLLWIQGEVHRMSMVQNLEATMLLARAAVETCIAGMYWLQDKDAAARLTGANAKALKQVLQFMADGEIVTPDALHDLASIIGQPKEPPSLLAMAQHMATSSGDQFGTDIYRRCYQPLSIFFAHPTGIAMLRHVRPDGQLRERPNPIWSRRLALHTIDACTARMAIAIAAQDGVSSRPFLDYANAHLARTPHPVMYMTSRGALRAIRPSRIPAAMRRLHELRRAVRDGELAAESYDRRKEMIKQAFAEIAQVLDTNLSDVQRDQILDMFAGMLADAPNVTPNA